MTGVVLAVPVVAAKGNGGQFGVGDLDACRVAVGVEVGWNGEPGSGGGGDELDDGAEMVRGSSECHSVPLLAESPTSSSFLASAEITGWPPATKLSAGPFDAPKLQGVRRSLAPRLRARDHRVFD